MVKLYLQEWRTEYLKLQMRYVDRQEVAVKGAKKLDGETKLRVMQLK